MKFSDRTLSINSISITKCFVIFSLLLLIINSLIYLYFRQKIFSQKNEVTLESQLLRVERALEDDISYSAYLMKYLGDQILKNDHRDLKYIDHLLSSFGLKSITENKTLWNMFSWSNSEMEIVVNSSFGIINPINIKSRDYIKNTVSDPGIIHLGKPSYGKVSGEWIIPTGMGVVDKKGQYLGAIVFGFKADVLTNNLKRALTDDQTSFVIYDYNMTQILTSDNYVSSVKFEELIKDALESKRSFGKLGEFSLLFSSQDYGYFKKIPQYNYIIVTKNDYLFSKQEVWSHVYPYIIEVSSILTIMAIMLYILKLMVISPIVKLAQVARLVAQDRDDEVVMVQSRIKEINDLIDQVSLIEKYKINLLQAKKSQERFFANMSHELRTPLNGILNFSMMIKNEMFGPVEPDYKEMAADINSSGAHLLNLVNDILDFSKMDIGKMKLNEEQFSVLEELRGALKIAFSEHYGDEDSKIKIISEIKVNENLEICADRRMFKQILLNLLSNAGKFVEKGSITVKLFRDETQDLVIEIIDTGIGIKEEDLKKLVVEFGQVGDGYYRGKKQGSGLGLFLVKKMTELHQGKFEISSVYNKGTTVRLVFPKDRIITN